MIVPKYKKYDISEVKNRVKGIFFGSEKEITPRSWNFDEMDKGKGKSDSTIRPPESEKTE